MNSKPEILTVGQLRKDLKNCTDNTVISFGGPHCLSVQVESKQVTIHLDPLPEWDPKEREWRVDGHDAPPPLDIN